MMPENQLKAIISSKQHQLFDIESLRCRRVVQFGYME